jgi:hypothetical protein
MDVFVSGAAGLQAEALLLRKTPSHGLILGLKRGPRFIVESFFPFPDIMSFPLDKYIQLTHIFGPDFIGFFSTESSESAPPSIMGPFAAGMLFCRFGKDNANMGFSQIDYNGKFILKKLEYSTEVSK